MGNCMLCNYVPTLLLFLSLTIRVFPYNEEHVLSPGGKPMLFVGIFQQDLAGSTYCQAAIRKGDLRKEQFFNSMMDRENFQVISINNIMTADDFTYIEKTFVGFDQLTEIIVGLKLNQSYFVDNDLEQDPKWNELKIQSWSTLSRIIMVVVYAGELESLLVKDFLYGEDFLVLVLNQENIVEDGNIHSSKDILVKNAENLLDQIVNWRQKPDYSIDYGVSYFIMVVIEGDMVYNMEFEYFYNNFLMKYYEELKRCHILYRLNISDPEDIQNFIQHLVNDNFLKFVIVFGKPKDQADLYAHYRDHIGYPPNMYWVFHDLNKDSLTSFVFHSSHHIYSFVAENYKYFSPGYFKDLLDSIKSNLTSGGELSLQETAIIKSCNDVYENQIVRMVEVINLFLKFDMFKSKSFQEYKRHCLNRIKTRKGNNRYWVLITENANRELTETSLITPITGVKTKCPILYCGPGKERYFGKITDNVNSWNNSFGWACKRCAVNHFKSFDFLDNRTCVQCPTSMITDKDQRECFDPYTSIFLGFNDIPGLTTVGICGAGFLLSLFNLVVLFKFRNTPFVKAFDLPKKLVQHLLFMLLSFVSFPFLFIGKPSPLKCFLQPVSILVLSICPSIIILLKSQKILLLFKSELRLSKGKRMRSLAGQVMTAMVIVVTDACILYLLMRTDPPSTIETYDRILFTRHIHCNNGGNINIQIAYLIALQLLSSVQAFRGRNLPGPFNEGLSIAFSTFVLVIAQTVQFPIYYLQQHIKVRSSVHAVVLSGSHLLFMAIYYGSKLHLVLFKRKRNTREHFRAEQKTEKNNQTSSKSLIIRL